MPNHDFSQVSDILLNKIQDHLRVFFNNEFSAKLVFGLVIALCSLALYLLINLALTFNSWDLPVATFPQNVESSEFDNIIIENKHLFGKITKPGATFDHAVKTRLPLTLKGLIIDNDPKAGTAIIAGPDNVEKSYHVGDKLPITDSLVILEYIFKDRVYIKNGDAIEYLLYPKHEFRNQPNGMMGGSNQFLPNVQDSSSIPDINIENDNENIERPSDANPENIERPPPAYEDTDRVSKNSVDANKFNRFHKKFKRNYN